MPASARISVVEQLRQHEKELPAARRSGDARALILAPTRALAVQIGLVAKSLSHHLRFRVRTLAKSIAEAYVAQREAMGHPLLPQTKGDAS